MDGLVHPLPDTSSPMLAIDSISGLGFRDTNLSNIMEPELPQVNLPRVLLRPEDASRLGRPSRFDDSDRPPRASSEDTRSQAQAQRADAGQTLDDSPAKLEETNTVGYIKKSELSLLSLEDTTELFKKKVADARQDTEHALAGSEAVRDVVKPKLTLDLGHSNIARLPESVVDLIKDEVERLSLSQNQIWHIPLRFSECTHLRYLNIRSNVFREIPRGVYKLNQLEILDISRNKVRKISPDIKNLRSLRVFSLVHNRVEELPTELCEMTKLQILKIAENPLRFRLKRVVEYKESEVSFSEMTDHERETAITLEIKRYLKEARSSTLAPIDVEASLQIDESPMETPKPLKRTLSSRFPVIPSTGSGLGEPGSEGNKSSPIQPNPPPMPMRSHFRMTSGTQTLTLRGPGITPLISQNSNERNRSNSESVLQASAAARHKRMGMLRREKPELDSIDETKVNRNSHLRGFSHGSVLKRNGTLSSPGGASSSSPNSPRDPRRNRLAFVKRLSSLPEHKVENELNSPVIDGAKGILYSLYQIHPHISGLIAAIRGKDVRRSTLEFTFFNASTHVDRLNEALEQAEVVDVEDEDAVQRVETTVRRDCATCIMAYTHVTAQLQDNVKKIVAGADVRYVRSLMLLLYGSMIEVRNAIQSFGADVNVTRGFGHRRQLSSGNTHPIQTIPEEFSTPSQPVRAITPTRDRNMPSRQGGRLRSDTTIQHPVAENVPTYAANPVLPAPSGSLPTPIHLTGTTLNSGNLTGTSSTFSNSGTLNGNGLRSRSSSRTAMMNGMPSSVASTPRSGEAFNLPMANGYPARINPATGLTDAQEEAVFEQIFLALSRAYDAALHTIPITKAQFIRCLEAAEENRQPKSVHDLWSTLVYRCKLCIDVSEALQIRLVNMRLKEPSVPGVGRNDPSLWSLCKNFLMSFIDLLTDMREAKSLRLLSQELIIMLRPVQKASREAGRLIETSPWRYLTDSATAAMPPPSVFNTLTSQQSAPTMNGNGYAHANSFNGASINGNASVYNTVTSSLGQHSVQSPFPPPLVPVPPVPGSGPNSANTPNTATMPKQMINVNGFALPNGSNGISPISVPLPATPLSAALGPAAQATVPNMNMQLAIPSTPASAYGDQFFRGDVFQRADSLLSMPQAGNVNFLNRR